MATRVLLADDHTIVRQGLRLLLQREGFEVVGEAANGAEAVRLATETMPEVVAGGSLSVGFQFGTDGIIGRGLVRYQERSSGSRPVQRASHRAGSLLNPPTQTIVFDGTVPNLDVTGALSGAVVQILPCCPADLDADCTVGISDLLSLLAAWGTAPGGPPDLDGGGDVGIGDLLELLAAWGGCP